MKARWLLTISVVLAWLFGLMASRALVFGLFSTRGAPAIVIHLALGAAFAFYLVRLGSRVSAVGRAA